MSAQSEPQVKHFEIKDFVFEDGTRLTSARLAYLDLNPEAHKTALIITCFRGRLQSTLNFSNGALQSHRIIVVALFGNGESSSPSNTERFPGSVDYRDCVRAQRDLLHHLGIQSLDVVLGFSMGGQCTYYWAVMDPEFVANAIVICSSARTSRHNYQFLEGPKAALVNSLDYTDTTRSPSSPPLRGLGAFGKAYSAWLTSAEWFEQEEYKSLGYETQKAWDSSMAVTSYYSWGPDDLLALLDMWQRGDITVLSGFSSLQAALAQIKARVLLMPCQTDQYFRWEASQKESSWIQDATLNVIPSIWGHLAGIGTNPVDREWMDKTIHAFLKG
ncbi:AB hydrolase-1 domain-containing protein [Fusarium falciforme]|uniref:AB hydrolase-1 domain-containing protein n=1 Tax=Fusarium falciforme TaxID=195108 RepID=UPI0023010FDA|nr:AB hydrolase-1 domain-containing protein [Fusarium falciforme]WAO91293.1 AB hydrolase-1 domain-containing protein [Fusarium falciforme]